MRSAFPASEPRTQENQCGFVCSAGPAARALRAATPPRRGHRPLPGADGCEWGTPVPVLVCPIHRPLNVEI